MDAQILLADAAQTSTDGKVHALGLGWSNTSTPTPAAAVVIIVRVPWDVSNDKHHATVALVTTDGEPVKIETPVGTLQMSVETEFETGRPPGLPKGTALDVPLTFDVPPGLALLPGRYEWRLTIDGEHKESWSAPFLVRG